MFSVGAPSLVIIQNVEAQATLYPLAAGWCPPLAVHLTQAEDEGLLVAIRVGTSLSHLTVGHPVSAASLTQATP